mmetsp:Transcript_4394/g.7337  ORF Transcript_4394/g.7337 Transcript_4394/m.7337 type:complete len:318 (-) Transcript_4394:344-1297(-)|eukprot:CAMPEP_0202693314 /NCGR_PEP_ID=MMETSP1385-20130828/7458_1 /ASSEMBLY_ACC=CAM_ASM_000861 /TAXON_ID=933848 /ORGANISM="Elphidium margaritaceum" /LENGTH=317 /DNA_ID=CAMNT_0049348975 /DNA_START=96 /DNA_END=1049 /DNA_ORIENTATION=-
MIFFSFVAFLSMVLGSHDDVSYPYYLDTPAAFAWIGEDAEFQDFFAMQKGCDAQPTQVYCSAASLACVLNSLLDDSELPTDPIYSPYTYATADDMFFGNDSATCVNDNVVRMDEDFNGVWLAPYGLTLDQATELVKCNIDTALYTVVGVHVDESVTVDEVRADFITAIEEKGGRVFINFHRSAIGQDGGGHFSPVVAYNEDHDAFLVYDVAKYKFPPYWVPAEDMHAAMQTVDSCGSWDFPIAQTLVNYTLLDSAGKPNLYSKATEAMNCEPAYRGFIVVAQVETADELWDVVEGENGASIIKVSILLLVGAIAMMM